jgi:hypothetical protein
MTTVPSSFSRTSARSSSENVTTSPGFTRFAGRHRLPRRRIALACEQKLDRVGHLPLRLRVQPRGNDARVVDDRHVAVAEKVGEIRERVVLESIRGRDDEHPRPPPLTRLLRDELLGSR